MTKEQLRALIAKRLRLVDVDAIRKSGGQPTKGGGGEKHEFSISKYMRGGLFGNWRDAEFEKSEYERVQKQLGSAVGTAGGFLVTPEYSAELIELLRARAVVRNLGVRVYPMSGDTLTFNRMTGAAVAYWVAEGATKTESQPTVGQATLVLKEVAGLVRSSNSLIQDASPAVDAIIRQDLVDVLVLAEDLAFIQGTGGTQPLGIYNDPNVPNTTLGVGNGATPTFDDLYDAMYAIEAANAMYTGWLMHPRTKNTLRKIKDGMGNYIYRIGDRAQGDPDTLFGLPVGLTTQVPINLTRGTSVDCSYVILGDWKEFCVGEKAGAAAIVIDVSTERYFELDQTAFRAVRRIDCMVRQPNAFYVVRGVRP